MSLKGTDMELPPPLLEHQAAVDGELLALMDESTDAKLPLYRMMRYQLGWLESDGSPSVPVPPSRLYGALCLESARSLNSSAPAGSAAAAVELFQNSVTVHQDMQLGEPHIETRPSVWWVWGPAQAINVGDGMYALARLGIFRLQSAGLSPELILRAVQMLDAAALRYYEGQFLELTYQERLDIRESQYLKMAEAKHGSLIGGAMALGAHAAGADEAMTSAFRRCGELLGVSSQISADEAQMWDSSAPGAAPARFLNKSKLLPVVYALEKGTLAQKRALGEVYFKRVLEPEDAQRVREVLDEIGVRQYSRQRAEATMREGLDALGAARLPADTMERWQAIAEYLVSV